MKSTKFMAVLLVLALLCTLTACGASDHEITMGTGGMGGNYYHYGNTLSQLLHEDNEALTVTVKTTAGSAANLRLMQKGFLDLAIVQSDTLLDACTGKNAFSGQACTGVRALAGLYTEECQIIVRKDSDIKTVADLYGKRVSVGEQESGVMENARQILQASGLTLESIVPQYLSFTDAAKAMEEGNLDAFFCTAGAPTTAVAELSRNVDIVLLPLGDDVIARLTAQYPCYTAVTIPAGTYNGQSEDVKTVGVKAVLVASSKLSDAMALQVMETLFGHPAEMQYALSAQSIDPEFASSAIPAPFHSGVVDWYAKQGITVSADASGSVAFGVTAGQD